MRILFGMQLEMGLLLSKSYSKCQKYEALYFSIYKVSSRFTFLSKGYFIKPLANFYFASLEVGFIVSDIIYDFASELCHLLSISALI